MKIQDVLASERYLKILEELKRRKIPLIAQNATHKTISNKWLKDHLKERQLVLEGFRCKLHTEEEMALWLQARLEHEEELVAFFCARHSREDATEHEEQYPEGEEPAKEDLPETVEVRGYADTCVAECCIDLDLVKNHPEKLAEYYKRLRIPHAAKHASAIRQLYRQLKL